MADAGFDAPDVIFVVPVDDHFGSKQNIFELDAEMELTAVPEFARG